MGFAVIESAFMKPDAGLTPALFVCGAKVQSDAVFWGCNALSTEITGVAAIGGYGISPDEEL